MKKVKIYKSGSGNTIFTDLDETDGGGGGGDKSKKRDVTYVYYGETTKAEMRKYITERAFLICLYHVDGHHNTAFLLPMTACLNYDSPTPDSEELYFVGAGLDGSVPVRAIFKMETGTWSED